MAITVELNLFNLIDGVQLSLYQATITNGGHWVRSPPQTLRPNKPADCKCSGPNTGYDVILVYKPDAVRHLTVQCKPTGTALNASVSFSPGYEVGLGPGGVSPDYILGLNYRRE